MAMTGGCYCRALRYEAAAEPVMFRAQCHCRECQYLSGGGPNMVMGLPAAGFRYVEGQPKQFTRADLADANTREFCANCGTQILTRLYGNADMVVLKIGTLDDPSVFGGPQMAVWLVDKPPYHLVPEGITTFPRYPGAPEE
jgi:hypothetical protein